MTYPVYTASAAVITLTVLDVPEGRGARDAWLRELRRRQLTEILGWGPGDPAFGGWGYSIEPPKKGEADGSPVQHIDADLSSTLFAIGALRIAGAAAEDPAIRKASTPSSSGARTSRRAMIRAIRNSMTAASSSRRPTQYATRPALRARIGTAGRVTIPMAVRRPTGCGPCFVAGSRRITRVSSPQRKWLWRRISRPRPIPARSSRSAMPIARRPITTTPGRSPTPSARWGSQRSTPTAGSSPGPRSSRTELIQRQARRRYLDQPLHGIQGR